jgi:hypothetical protein
MKRRRAPPIPFSITISTELKLIVTLATSVLEITNPDATCSIIQIPLSEPKFHHILILLVEEKFAPNPRLKVIILYIIQWKHQGSCLHAYIHTIPDK